MKTFITKTIITKTIITPRVMSTGHHAQPILTVGWISVHIIMTTNMMKVTTIFTTAEVTTTMVTKSRLSLRNHLLTITPVQLMLAAHLIITTIIKETTTH